MDKGSGVRRRSVAQIIRPKQRIDRIEEEILRLVAQRVEREDETDRLLAGAAGGRGRDKRGRVHLRRIIRRQRNTADTTRERRMMPE